MRLRGAILILAAATSGVTAGCTYENRDGPPEQPQPQLGCCTDRKRDVAAIAVDANAVDTAAARADAGTCEGQARIAFAALGDLAETKVARALGDPRQGLTYLAGALSDRGLFPDPSIKGLAGFLRANRLSIDACLSGLGAPVRSCM